MSELLQVLGVMGIVSAGIVGMWISFNPDGASKMWREGLLFLAILSLGMFLLGKVQP